ncbi:MAG: DJ-1/PfpI family protein [Chitinophagaceae bacterium]|nr:MAG: DJ-1/PfpI family protein [Chitinophagaceae bacterium]
MVLFEDFELLDAFGPLEMFGLLKEKVRIVIIGEKHGFVKSSAGPATLIETTFAENPKPDILMIPGGRGTRRLVTNQPFLAEISKLAIGSGFVASICTGAAVLARAGLLENKKATTNKKSYEWVTTQGDNVEWQQHARWVVDGNFFTSSGVSAGIDMALGLIAKIYGEETARQTAALAEYQWNSDPDNDPFAQQQ